jgi:hypothetical protein
MNTSIYASSSLTSLLAGSPAPTERAWERSLPSLPRNFLVSQITIGQNCDVKQPHVHNLYCDANDELAKAIFDLYMGPSTFLQIFRETPLQAIAALESDPKVFGQLRNYVGPISLKANHRKLVRIARKLMAPCSKR